MKKLLFVAAAAVMVFGAVPRADSSASSKSPRASSSGDVIEQVLVKVNGDIITKTELEAQQIQAIRERLNRQSVDPGLLKSDEQLKKVLAEVTPQVLVNAIDELLLLQHGKELNLHLTDDQFKQIVANIRKEQGLSDDKKFQEALAQENMTMDDLRKSMEKRMIIEQVQRAEVGSKLTITEEEARQYYARHPEEFTDATMITLREIMIEVPSTSAASSAADQAALAKINDARARALRAEDFAKLAAEVSNSASKANGGLIGPFSRDDMSPTLQAIVDKMTPGEITQPIRTAKGYQIFKLESVKPAAVQPFDSVRDVISDKVAAARTQTEMRKFLARLRTQAIIEWKNEELKKVYEKQIAAEPIG